jgi:hypothetical protein
MASKVVSVSVENIEFHVLPMRTRFPFQYGIASLTALPHLFITATVVIDGQRGIGISAEGLPPKWFTKDPNTTFEDDLPEMFAVIRNAASIAKSVTQGASFFTWWQQLYEEQSAWAVPEGIPLLLANLGVSIMERAVMDGLCRLRQTTFAHAVHANILGIQMGQVYPELDGLHPGDLLPSAPSSNIIARHTVGLGDSLTDQDIEEPLNDGLPYSLEACIAAYGLDYFKVKLSGDLERDQHRLFQLNQILEKTTGGNYKLTLDGNEQFRDVVTFRNHWDSYQTKSEIRSLFEHLLFVEQPLHRDYSLADEVRTYVADWKGAPPLIIDESDAEIGSVIKALDLGYSGTSHKNCKGIIKGIVNACLIEHRRRENPDEPIILSGEDLGNVGPVALLQDLTVMSVLGIPHVERNGHHYFKGLSMLPESIQTHMLESHGDLYRKHDEGFPALNVVEGKLSIESILKAPFGVNPLIEVSQFVRLEDWDMHF